MPHPEVEVPKPVRTPFRLTATEFNDSLKDFLDVCCALRGNTLCCSVWGHRYGMSKLPCRFTTRQVVVAKSWSRGSGTPLSRIALNVKRSRKNEDAYISSWPSFRGLPEEA